MTPRLGWPDACQPGFLSAWLPVSPVAWFCGRLAARLPGFAADWLAGCPVSAQKPFYHIFSSLWSSFEREILVRTNTFFIFFGTEALKVEIIVHEKQHLPGNLVS